MKKRRVYWPCVVGGQVMLQADLERLHKYMREVERIDHISDEMRAVVESEWPELAPFLVSSMTGPIAFPGSGARVFHCGLIPPRVSPSLSLGPAAQRGFFCARYGRGTIPRAPNCSAAEGREAFRQEALLRKTSGDSSARRKSLSPARRWTGLFLAPVNGRRYGRDRPQPMITPASPRAR
jgi:hypothetical protein